MNQINSLQPHNSAHKKAIMVAVGWGHFLPITLTYYKNFIIQLILNFYRMPHSVLMRFLYCWHIHCGSVQDWSMPQVSFTAYSRL